MSFQDLGVQEAVVVAREDVAGERRLVAYYTVSNANEKDAGAAELRAHLSGKLPDYMVPAAYVRVEQMPLTANGKLDRKALPEPDFGVVTTAGFVAPRTDAEQDVVGSPHVVFDRARHAVIQHLLRVKL